LKILVFFAFIFPQLRIYGFRIESPLPVEAPVSTHINCVDIGEFSGFILRDDGWYIHNDTSKPFTGQGWQLKGLSSVELTERM
jgi:hypothetical protein